MIGVVVAAVVSAMGVLAAALAAGGSTTASDLADPGILTRWGLPALRTAYDLTAIGTIGTIVVAVLLLPATGGVLGPQALRLVRVASRWAVAWAVTAVLGSLLTVSDAMGVPVWDVLALDVLPLALDLPQAQALLASGWLAGLVAVWSRWSRSPAAGGLLLLTAAGALLPPLLSGHAGHGDNDTLSVAGLAVHVGAAAVWVGGLLALALHLRREHAVLAAALPRYSQLALGCFAAVGLSGAVTGWISLTGLDDLWTTPYGRLLLFKVAALVVLGGVGYLHRRRTVAAVARRRPRAFLRLAAVELVLMAATAGLAVGLSRTAPPEPVGGHGVVALAQADAASAAVSSR